MNRNVKYYRWLSLHLLWASRLSLPHPWNKSGPWSVWDEQAPCQEETIWAHYRGNSRNQSSRGNITQPRSNRMLSQGHPLSSIFPEKHVEENAGLNVTVNSALMSSSYLISATLNTEWLAWIVDTPQKSTFMIKEW